MKCLLIALVVAASSTGCILKSKLAATIPPPVNIDGCYYGRDKKSKTLFFGCADQYRPASRANRFVSLDEMADQRGGAFCIPADQQAEVDAYDDKVYRRIKWLEKRCGDRCR